MPQTTDQERALREAAGALPPGAVERVGLDSQNRLLGADGGVVLDVEKAQAQVSKMSLSSASAISQGLKKRHLQKLAATTTTAKVAIIGDSTTTPDMTGAIASSETLWSVLQAAVARDNPGRTITFGNFGIGASNWNHVNQTGTATGLVLPSWFTNPAATWLSYVQTFAPDVLFVLEGTNAASSPSQTTFIKTFLTTVAGWAKVPDVILITNKVANVNAGGQFAADQDRYLGIAGLVRSICLTNGASLAVANQPPLGLLDIGRLYAMSLGKDPCVQRLEVVTPTSAPIAGITAFPYTLPRCDGDFRLTIVFPGQTVSLWDGGATNLQITLSDYSQGADSTSKLNFFPGGAFVGTQHWSDAQVTSGTSIPKGTGDFRIEVIRKQERIIVYVNNTLTMDARLPNYHHPYSPKVTIGGSPTAPNMTVARYSAGRSVTTDSTVDLDDFWGSLSGPYGGNGINHPSALGVAQIDAAAISAVSFDPS